MRMTTDSRRNLKTMKNLSTNWVQTQGKAVEPYQQGVVGQREPQWSMLPRNVKMAGISGMFGEGKGGQHDWVHLRICNSTNLQANELVRKKVRQVTIWQLQPLQMELA